MKDNEHWSLFSKKEMYRLAHDKYGRSFLQKEMPPIKRRKMMDDNMHLMRGMRFENGYPLNAPYTGRTDFSLVAFNERKKCRHTNNACLHSFIDDYRFRNLIWYNLERITYEISPFDYLFTPDLSLWRNLKTEFYNKKNIFRTRFVGAYWQMCGFNVIPTAS